MAPLIKYKEVSPQYIKSILASFFNPAYAASIRINDNVVEVVWEMVSKSKECTKALNLVPRPAGFIPGASFVAMQLAKLGQRLLAHQDEDIANTCKSAASSAYSTRIRMASHGL